ncbi:MAG TPA: arabinan endo-1,5-alpha-L-arabinosidase [Terriglobales bacterium]|nr:arabinan endo-1,5-alpha-L-arabinosidase [Terriglobales bacterium]
MRIAKSLLVLLLTLPAFSQVVPVTGDTEFVHDPAIINDDDTWYLFSTGNGPDRKGDIPVRCSKDLHAWKKCGQVFDAIPEWIKQESPETKELWAPDLSYFNGEFHLYYAFSVFGKNTSGIALLTNKTLDPASPNYHWKDQGLILRSRVEDDFNAIDPNLVIDKQGRAWLSFGSFWSGIKMRRIDFKTGKLSTEDSTLYSLASRRRPANPPPNPPGLPGNWQAIEAPFIVEHDGFFYLFTSFDLCCRGTKSTYKTMVGRSKEVTGPYLDANGTPLMEGGGTLLMEGNSRWFGPGGESLLLQKDGDIMVFHAYDGATGHAWLQISKINWENGWPRVVLAEK